MKKLVVFGATSAISQAFLNRVAKKYSTVVLIARDSIQLEEIAAHVRIISGAKVEVIVSDLARIDTHANLVEQSCNNGVICALISYGQLTDQERCKTDPRYAMEQFALNGTSTISLSAAVTSVFAKQGGGVLAVVGSVAGDRGRRSNYYYGAAKSAVASFLSGLRSEMLQHGVTVVTVKPGFVDTPMTQDFKKGFLWASAEKVAADIDSAIERKRSELYTPWFWRYIMWVIKCIPEWLFKKLPL